MKHLILRGGGYSNWRAAGDVRSMRRFYVNPENLFDLGGMRIMLGY